MLESSGQCPIIQSLREVHHICQEINQLFKSWPFGTLVSIRHGVKYIEMYLNTNTNTFEGFKYKYFQMQMYLNTNTNTFEKYFKYFFKYFSFSGYITIQVKETKRVRITSSSSSLFELSGYIQWSLTRSDLNWVLHLSSVSFRLPCTLGWVMFEQSPLWLI